MMKRLNLFYISLFVIGAGLIIYFAPKKENEVAFFGFAENLETEINYNYPVMVDRIFVSPGESISKDTVLIKLLRIKAKEELDKQSYQIATLQSEMDAWNQKQESEKVDLILKYQEEVQQIEKDIAELNLEIEKSRALHSKLFEGNFKVSPEQSSSLQRYESEKAKLTEDHLKRLSALEKETIAGLKPFLAEMTELDAEDQFEKEHKVMEILVKAPQSGLIGNINCREGEHIPAFKTLMTIYEPHSTIVKGYVHEESILDIGEEVRFEVASLLEPDHKYSGKLIGMGSRIVEIPTRLRKFPQIKTYGREITIEIPADNIFLQKEKVSVKFMKEN